MGPHPNLLLVLMLCLGQAVHTQDQALPKPSIWAEPGPVIPRGQPVTIVCRGPAGADTFRLERKEKTSVYWNQKIASRHGSQGAEATFHIEAVSDITARSYFCFYLKGSNWSEPSEPLELKMTDGDVSTPPSGTTPEVTPPSTGVGSQTAPTSRNYTVGNCVRIGLTCMVLLILVAILAEAGHSWRRWPYGPQRWKQERSC